MAKIYEHLSTLLANSEPAEFQETKSPRSLSNRDRDIFLALLYADLEPTEAAKKAAAEYNKGWHDEKGYHFQIPAFDPKADVEPHETGDEI